ncbi:MAG TPA: HAD family acid phosphatase [Gemmatimonadales bacterium]|nr:HAD family acid phosphatase [Gemmatimonadales bacterium]
MRFPRSLALAAALAGTLASGLATGACAPRATIDWRDVSYAGATAPAPARIITFEQLKRSLATPPPSTVVFDIDDTALRSSPAFLFGEGWFEGRGVARPHDDPAFWTFVNDSLDARFSRPKLIALALVAMHQARGDTIVFLTGRSASTPPSDRTSLLLQRLFALPAPPRVVFTQQGPKVEAIRALHPAIAYGDADGDIRDTRAADPRIRPIRLLRSVYSSNASRPTPGRFGEEVLAGSAD